MNREVFVSDGFHLVNRAYSLFVGMKGSRPYMTSRPQEATLFQTSAEANKQLSGLLASKSYGDYTDDLVRQGIDAQYDPRNWLVVPASIRIEHGPCLN